MVHFVVADLERVVLMVVDVRQTLVFDPRVQSTLMEGDGGGGGCGCLLPV